MHDGARHVLVLGASGLVGHAAARHFAAQPGCRVSAVSRRPPLVPTGAPHLALDLLDPVATAAALAALPAVTHVVYAAVQEQAALVAGWTDADHLETNARMLRHLLDALQHGGHPLRHISLLQGPKAYGVHVGAMPTPAREDRDERRELPNFYWLQQDELRARQAGQGWHWTVFRPVMVVGEAVGAPMNLLAALGVYAAVMPGDALPYPGAPGLLKQPTDVDLLARAIDWAGRSVAAADQVFNVDNGEVFAFDDLWPVVCQALGRRPGAPQRLRLAELLPVAAAAWDARRRRHQLRAPALDVFLGASAQLADFSLGNGEHGLQKPAILSGLKLRRAGFAEVQHSETMFRTWFQRYQQHRLLPPPESDRDVH